MKRENHHEKTLTNTFDEESMLVSILIPAYNTEKFIAASISSALAQDWCQKEIIIVDDGSTDETACIAKTFESRNVKLVTTRNRGASAARNTALRYAQGDYIQWLDSDDLLAPDKLSQQLREAERNAANRLLFSGSYAEFTGQPRHAQFIPSALWRDLEPVDYLITRFEHNLWMSPGVWLVSRKLTDLAGPWDERISLDDDGEYFTRVVSNCEHIRFVPEARVYYRRANVGSLSRRVSASASESLLLSLSLCAGYLRMLEDSDRSRAASLKFLQSWIDLTSHFYPDDEDLFRRVCQLGREFGGALTPPRLGWKYAPIRAAFGWRGVRSTKSFVSKVKFWARLQRDRLLHASAGTLPIR